MTMPDYITVNSAGDIIFPVTRQQQANTMNFDTLWAIITIFIVGLIVVVGLQIFAGKVDIMFTIMSVLMIIVMLSLVAIITVVFGGAIPGI